LSLQVIRQLFTQLHAHNSCPFGAYPACRFFLKLFAAQSRQGVKFGPPVVLASLPLGGDPSLLFQLVQGVEWARDRLPPSSAHLSRPCPNSQKYADVRIWN